MKMLKAFFGIAGDHPVIAAASGASETQVSGNGSFTHTSKPSESRDTNVTTPTWVDAKRATKEVAQSSSNRIEGRLQLIFAIQGCLGGLVLSSADGAELIPVVAIFFAVFGYLFVDLFTLFALPPLAAYFAMGLVALYSVGQFMDFNSPNQQQMIAVGELLVLVQSILMLQQKNRRIYEQLVIFSLLELIVAAVFNNAIYYGLLLVPMAILAMVSLCLMSVLQSCEGLSGDSSPDVVRSGAKSRVQILTWSPSTVTSFSSSSMRTPRFALTMLVPSVILVGSIFFYGLPRIGDSARLEGSGQSLVGFNDELRLGQFGSMLLDSTQAMRVTLRHHNSTRPYRVADGIYLRGRALESYYGGTYAGGQISRWNSANYVDYWGFGMVPRPFNPPRASDKNFYDVVDVEVICESMRTPTLFAIAPYHHDSYLPQAIHSLDTWTLSRRELSSRSYSRLEYDFVSNGFFRGEQSRVLTPRSVKATDIVSEVDPDTFGSELNRENQLIDLKRREEEYDELTRFVDPDVHPATFELADRIANQISPPQRNPYTIAVACEQFLKDSNLFTYSLNLNAEPVPGLDPIEQFLTIDRKGHCQFFASALALMLRSQGIPTRMVAGYHTDEFNELGGYYIARQLHAHAWVEALLPASALPSGVVYGQLPSDVYWVRFDPTPIANRESRSAATGVGQVMNLAQNIWDEYVVDMDAKRQNQSALGASGYSPMSDSYASFLGWLQLQVSRIRNGELGGGALAGRGMFSLPAAVATILLVLFVAAIFKIRFPEWVRGKRAGAGSKSAAEPTIPFFAETLRQLARLGLYRQPSETPSEFTTASAVQLSHPQLASLRQPLALLTAAFYRYRFGDAAEVPSEEKLDTQIQDALAQVRKGIDTLSSENQS